MRRKLLATAGSLTLGAAALVTIQITSAPTAAAVNVCQPVAWGDGNRWAYTTCSYVDAFPKWRLMARCTDGSTRAGNLAWTHSRSDVRCPVPIQYVWPQGEN